MIASAGRARFHLLLIAALIAAAAGASEGEAPSPFELRVESLEELIADDHAQDGIAQEFQTLVAVEPMVGQRGVRQGLLQQARADGAEMSCLGFPPQADCVRIGNLMNRRTSPTLH